MGRIQTGQTNLPGPPPPQYTSPLQPYPPQTHPTPPQQYNLQQPPAPPNAVQPPPPLNVVHTMPPSNPPQMYGTYQGNPAQYNQVPVPAQYGAGSGITGASVQATVASPLQTSNMYNTGGGMQPQLRQQSSTYPGSSGFQMPKLGPRGKRGFVGTNPWRTGLYDCMQEPSNALITALFPCITFGQIADVLDNGNTTCVTSGILYAFSPCMLSRPYRTKLRRKFGLVEAPAADWMVHSMFEPCALCQEYRELKLRGIDPALGYHGNKERLQNQQAANNPPGMMVPPQSQTMG